MENTKTANQINFDFNGKHYCLEYTRETVKMMEAGGFNINDVDAKPATRIEQLWFGAFAANHRNTSQNLMRAIYDQMKNKELLLTKLSEMYNNTLSYLMGDEGNVDWTATL